MRTSEAIIGLVALVCSSQALAQAELTEPGEVRPDPGAEVDRLRARLLAEPENSDLLRRLAAAQAAAGDLTAAQATIDRAAEIAPQDNDVLLARARILLWSGRLEDSRAQLGAVAARDPSYPELAEVEQALSRAERGPEVLRSGVAVSAGISEIEFDRGGSSTWKSLGASAFSKIDKLTTISGAVDYEKRAASDVRLELRGEREIGKGSLFLAGSVTPSADFREKYSVSVGGQLPLTSTLDLLFDARHAEYSTNGVTTFRPAVRLRPLPPLALTVQWIGLFEEEGGNRSGVSGRLDYTLDSGTGLYLGAATYPDTEAGITRTVRSAFAGAAIPISDRLTLRGAAEYERRDASYKRKALTIGLGWWFGS